MLILPKKTLWRHLPEIATSTPFFWLVQNERSVYDVELFTIWISLSIVCLYPVDSLRDSIYWPGEWVISFCLNLVQQTLKSPVTVEHKGNSSIILLRSKSSFEQKSSNSWPWLGEQYIQAKKHFWPSEQIPVTKQLSKVQISLLLFREIWSL